MFSRRGTFYDRPTKCAANSERRTGGKEYESLFYAASCKVKRVTVNGRTKRFSPLCCEKGFWRGENYVLCR